MDAQTRERTIKVHTIVITDPEIEAALNDSDPLLDFLRNLLISKPIVNGNGRDEGEPRKKKKQRSKAGTVNCRYCARIVSTRQIRNHEHKCPQRPQTVAEPITD